MGAQRSLQPEAPLQTPERYPLSTTTAAREAEEARPRAATVEISCSLRASIASSSSRPLLPRALSRRCTGPAFQGSNAAGIGNGTRFF